MEAIDTWLRQQAEREARRPSLEEALLGNRFMPYALYRLRYFLVRYCATAAVHASVALLLYRTFGAGFSWILAAYAATSFVENFWWGGLEAMRGQVRALHRAGKPHLVPAEIGRWLSLSLLLAVATSAGLGAWLGWQLEAGGGVDPAHAYVFVLLSGLAIQLIARCYHSGIYALRRVYRPLGAIVAIETVSLVGILGLRPMLGAWAFAVSALLSLVTVSAVSIYYTRRAYQLLRLAPHRRLGLRRQQLPSRAAAGEALVGGLSFGVMSLDSLLVLLLFGSYSGLHPSRLFLVFFVASPTIRASFDWSRLLYFDLKRLEIRLFRNLRRRFRRASIYLALALGFVFWLAASATGTAVVGHSLGVLYWSLLLFFIARSLLAVAQLDAFASRAYGVLLTTGFGCLGAFLALGLLEHDQGLLLLGISGVALIAALPLLLLTADGRLLRHKQERLWLSEWLAELRAVQGPARVCSATLWSEPLERWTGTLPEWQQRQRWRRRQLSEQIARRLGSRGAITVAPDGVILWFERDNGTRCVSDHWLLRRSAGFVQSVRDQGVHRDGPTALMAACRTGALGLAFRDALQAEARLLDPADVKSAFTQIVPSGVVYAPDEPVPEWLARLSSSDKHTILAAAASFARAFQPTRSRSEASLDVTALCDQGQLRYIFVIGQDADPRTWHTVIRRLNIQLAVGSTTLGPNSSPHDPGRRPLPDATRHLSAETEPVA